MAEDAQMEQTIKDIIRHMEMLMEDTSVPKNVRSAITEARNKLASQGEYIVRISSAIYSLDAVSNDINLPPQARTGIWSILSMLESIKTA
ncbi:MAG TPA: UPF0147 family protein [Candidatus Acidoferrales bacterium]|nr:UPF0147 family protein [Candidatus Acidoferrales bacterium]